MKRSTWTLGFLILAIVCAAAPVFLFNARAKADESARVIDIHAKRFGFTPDSITLKRGETVKLHLTSEDVSHGFFLRALGIDSDIDPGKTTEVTVTPQVVGKFTTICDRYCGTGHGNMHMTIEVVE